MKSIGFDEHEIHQMNTVLSPTRIIFFRKCQSLLAWEIRSARCGEILGSPFYCNPILYKPTMVFFPWRILPEKLVVLTPVIPRRFATDLRNHQCVSLGTYWQHSPTAPTPGPTVQAPVPISLASTEEAKFPQFFYNWDAHRWILKMSVPVSKHVDFAMRNCQQPTHDFGSTTSYKVEVFLSNITMALCFFRDMAGHIMDNWDLWESFRICPVDLLSQRRSTTWS